MFKREIENELKKWKQSLPSSRQAVVVKGLRQIGKTTSFWGFVARTFPRSSTSTSDAAFKLIKGNLGQAGEVVTLPWHMSMFLLE